MKKAFVLVALAVWLAGFVYASQTSQQNQAATSANAQAKSQTQANAQSGAVSLDAGAQIQAEMASALDLKKAKPGQPFKMKTTRPVKRDGKEIISRGSTVTGHVEQVTRADHATQATLVFDQIVDKKTGATSSLVAVVTTIARANQNLSSMANDEMTSNQSITRSQPSARQQSGGLLGGVANTVGGVTGQVTSTVDTTTQTTLGTGSVARPVGGLAGGAIQIVNNTTTSVASGSTLSMADRNAKIESGTQFVLQTTSALMLTKTPKEK